MSALEQFDPIVTAAADANSIDPRLIRAVMQVESSGNPNAIGSKPAIGTERALGLMQLLPSTATSLGVTNPLDPEQSINGGAKLLSQLLAKHGNIDDAVSEYHGGPNRDNWGPRTMDYGIKVANVFNSLPTGQKMPQTDAVADDPLLAKLNAYRSGATVVLPSPTPAPGGDAPAQETGDPLLDKLNAYRSTPGLGFPVNDWTNRKLTPEEQSKLDSQPRVEVSGVAGDSTKNPMLDMKDENGLPNMDGAITLGLLRGGKNIIDAGAHGLAWTYDKANHLLGGSGTAYDDVTAADKAGQQQFRDWVKAPEDRTAAAIGSTAGEIGGSLLLPQMALMKGATLLPRIVNGGINGSIAGLLLGDSNPDASAAGNAGMGAGLGSVANSLLPPVVQKGRSALNALVKALRGDSGTAAGAIADVAPGAAQAVAADAQSATKPRLKLNGDGTVTPLSGSVPQTPSAVPPMQPIPGVAGADKIPQSEQTQRAAVLQAIGLDTNRPSVVTGDKFASGNEYQVSKLDNPSGQIMRDQLAKEQNALQTYGGKLVGDTGGTAGATPTNRGEAIVRPLKGLSDWFDSSIGKLYTQARAKAGELGKVTPDNLSSLLKNNDFRENFLTTGDGSALLSSIDRQVKRFQGLPIEGEAQAAAPGTVDSAENLRKWLNNQWTPQNSRLIGQVKQALDMDVATVGGENVFSQARQLHALRANTLDNPKGIASILSESGPDGINRAIPIEKVAAKITSMPDAQFGHIVDTLNGNMPKEVSGQAQQALNEIRAHLMEQLVSAGKGSGAGQWNATAFNKAATELQGKLGKVFSPDELSRIKTLHDAGYILNTPTAYPGAAAQAYNLWQRGAMTGLPTLGATIGGTFGGGVGAGIGSSVGGAAAGVVKKMAETSNAAKLAEMLRNPGGAQAPGRMQFGLNRDMSAAVANAALIEALRQRQAQQN